MKKILIFFICLISGFFLISENRVSVSRLKERVESIGGLRFKSNVEIVYLNDSEFRKFLNKNFSEKFSSESVKKNEIFLNLMGFMSNGRPMIDILRRINNNIVGIVYDEILERIVINKKLKNHQDKLNDLILVFKLREMVREQNYPLKYIMKKYREFDDRKLALLSVSTGDAMLIMSLYAKVYTPFPIEAGISESGYSSASLLTFSPIKFSYNLDGLPEVIKNYQIMPYIRGLRFVFNILMNKKMKGLKRVLSNPPVSTEQILHPKKYLKNELPVNVKISFIPEKYTLFYSGTIGEYLLNILIMQKKSYNDFAEGWGGDRFNLFLSGRKYFLVWKSIWDNEKTAKNFYFIFKSFLENKYSISFRKGNIKGNPFIASKSDNSFFFVRLFKDRIFYVKTSDREAINKFIEGGFYD